MGVVVGGSKYRSIVRGVVVEKVGIAVGGEAIAVVEGEVGAPWC